MPYESKTLGAGGHVVRYRLRFLQRTTNTSLTSIARAMRELNYPMSAARIGEAFNGYRRISLDELLALATALGVSVGELFLGESPAADTAAVDKIAVLDTSDLKVRWARTGFEIADVEQELDAAHALTRRERHDAGTAEPPEIQKRLEAKAIELVLLDAEIERRLGKDWISGER